MRVAQMLLLGELMLRVTLAAALAAWRALAAHRIWSIVPLSAFAAIWALTPTVFWPMIEALWAASTGEFVRDADELREPAS